MIAWAFKRRMTIQEAREHEEARRKLRMAADEKTAALQAALAAAVNELRQTTKVPIHD
jgi:Na+-transporting methylmalonyl-CoA/oxaloacetate decarboxylase gamma subunit